MALYILILPYLNFHCREYPKKSGDWYRGAVDAANWFVTRWHSGETEKSSPCHVAVDAKSNKREPGGRGGGEQLYSYSGPRMQKRNDRSCGKVLVRLLGGTCATISLNPIGVVVLALFVLFVSVEFNDGSAKVAEMKLVLLFFVFFFALFIVVVFLWQPNKA